MKISFSDPKVKSLCVANWDVNGDGELSMYEAGNVTSLGMVFNGAKISSFHELLYFTGLTSIPDRAFSGSSLTAITLPVNITILGNYAFFDCVALASITIPAKLQSIGQNALSGCTSMTSINVADGNDSFCSVDGVLFSKDKTTLLQFPAAKTNDSPQDQSEMLIYDDGPVITNSSEVLANGVAVFDNSMLESNETVSYTIPYGTMVIGPDAFYKCKLESVILPTSLRELSYNAFGYSTDLTELTIPEGVKTISNNILDQCSNLKVLRIPSTVTSIGHQICNGCNAITDVFCDIIQPFGINSNNFMAKVYANATLHVSPNSAHAYETTEGWKEFKNINKFMDNFTFDKIKYGVISSDTHELEVLANGYSGHITIPATVPYHDIVWKVTQIASNAFSNCPQLITVSVPSTIEDCGTAIFEASERLSAIIWHPHFQPTKSQIGEILNHNLLFYANASEFAPTNIDNVVVNNHANQIKLVENNEFFCPQQFVADMVVFTHHYTMQTGFGESKGWETIVLPFNVSKITHATKGEIVPFALYSADNGTHPFWLYEYNNAVGFVEATSIKANRPYIISMPNNSHYADEYNLMGNVEFSSENVNIASSESLEEVTFGDNKFCPTFSSTSRRVKALNVNNDFVSYQGSLNPGSTFIYGLREVRPFEAYMTSVSGAMAPVSVFDELSTIIGPIPQKDIVLDHLMIFSTSGQLVKICDNCSQEDALHGLIPGVYIVNGHKMVVR